MAGTGRAGHGFRHSHKSGNAIFLQEARQGRPQGQNWPRRSRLPPFPQEQHRDFSAGGPAGPTAGPELAAPVMASTIPTRAATRFFL